jgi:phenylacetate-CoA ligase
MSNADGESMTLLDDNLMFEFYEDHSIITNLFNHTLPLIRYRMSDILRPVSPPGAPRIIIENLVGRTEKLPLFVNASGDKDFVSPHTINEIFVQGVTRFQMQITGDASFRFPICVELELNSAQRSAAVAGVEARLTEILAQKGLSNVTFEVPIVENIPLSERTRKFQLIVT